MKKCFISAMVALSSMSIHAQDFEVDGIYYNITSASNLTVEVTNGGLIREYSTNGDYIGYRNRYHGNIVVPERVQFSGNTYTITSIGKQAFATLNSSTCYIESVSIPGTVILIGESAFEKCRLGSFILPSSLESIGKRAFYGCQGTFTLSNSLKRIEENAFEGCTFQKMIIPSMVTYIGAHAFPSSLRALIMLPYNPPNGYYSVTSSSTEVIVPSKDKYLNTSVWSSCNLIEMLTPTSRSFEYNGQVPTIEWTNNLSGYTMNVSDGTLQKDAGTHSTDVKADFYKDDELEFSVEFPFEYTINKATLNAKVNNVSREYGEDNPSFSITYSGFVNNENESVVTIKPTITTTATKISNVGEYSIMANGGEATNYDFAYESGVLTVTKAPLSAIVNDATKVYGANNPSFTINYYGLKNEETAPAWTTSPTFRTEATKQSGVGQYTVNAINGVPKNYELGEITSGTLTITPAPLTIKANNASRLYFDDDPEISFTCSGFQNNENSSVLTELPSFTTDAVKTSNVGTYTITPSGAEAKNYDISYKTGTLTISKRDLTATPDNTSREYGEANPNFTISYSGFVNDETESSLSEIPSAASSAVATSAVGNYTISLNGGSATNYKVILKTGTLTVTKAPISVIVNDTTKVYGSDNPSFSLSYLGLKNNEVVPSWTTSPTFSTTATKTSDVGIYEISANCVAKNYDVAITSGTLTVTPATLTIKANNATREYYNDNPTFSYTCNGFVNDDNESILSPTPTLSTTAIQSSNVGTYEISVEGASSPNYSISYIKGALTVTPRTLLASVGNYSRLYNEENPEFEVMYNGFAGSEDESVLNEAPVASTTATKISNVGTYNINVSGGSADNYTFSYTSGTLTINKAEQTIAWNQELSNLNVGDQVELKAVASSGLPITYTMDDNGVAEIYSAGNRYYLDCLTEGQFIIRAVQNGDNNYYSSPRASKAVTIIGNTPSNSPTLTINQADNGTISMQVSRGKTYTFTIAPNYGWKIHSVMFNNTDVTNQLSSDYKYTTPVIINNSWLSVVYEKIDEDAVTSVAESDVKIQGTSFGARVIDAEMGDMIRVYTTDGKLQHSVKVESSRVDIPLEKDNIYIIQVGTKTMKMGY